jgi:hypothetical protein
VIWCSGRSGALGALVLWALWRCGAVVLWCWVAVVLWCWVAVVLGGCPATVVAAERRCFGQLLVARHAADMAALE